MSKFEQFNQKPQEGKKIITEESFGKSLSDEEIKERRKMIEDMENSQRNRGEYKSDIELAKEKIEKGELITSIEAGLLRAEDYENIEKETEKEIKKLFEPEIKDDKEEKKDTIEPKNETIISENVSKEALEKFNIKEEDLKKTEGFSDLSEGQQKLVLQNLRQTNLVGIKANALEKLNEDNKSRGFLGKLLQGIVGSDKFKLARLEKEEAIKIEKGGLGTHGKNLNNLTKGMKEFGPKVEGEKQISYISEKEFDSLNDKQREAIKKYNEVAVQCSKLPEEYGFESANKKDRAGYDQMTAKYEQAQKNFLGEFKEVYGNEKDAMLRLNKADFGVRMNQFVTNHPDVEKQFEKIKDDRWWKILGKGFAEKGFYGGAGYLSRSVTVGALGYIGVPIAAAGMGGWLSYKRANEEVRKKEILGREGVEDKSKTAKNFVKADTLATNFDRLMSRIKEESGKPVPNEAKIKELKESLSLRIKYASDKMDQGLVDFGATKAQLSKTAEERAESEKRGVLGNKFFLFRKFSEAMIAGEFNAPNEQGEVFKKLESFLNFQEERISKAERNYLIKQTLKGAGIAAGFAVGGYLIRHFGSEWFKWGAEKEHVMEPAENINNKFSKIKPLEGGTSEVESKNYIWGTHTDALGFKVNNVKVEEDILSGIKEIISTQESIGKVLGVDVDNIVFNKGIHKIKDFGEKGFSLVLKKAEDGSVKFGIDGPTSIAKYNWGADGKSWLFKADADLSVENLSKAKEFINKASKSFYNYEEAVKKSEGDGIFS